MLKRSVWGAALVVVVGGLAGACDSTSSLSFGDDGSAGTGPGGAGPGPGSGGQISDDGQFNPLGGGGAGPGPGTGSVGNVVYLEGLRVEPEDATLDVLLGQSKTLAYSVFGQLASGQEIDITDRSVFYVPDNFLVGGFPADGGPLFSTRLPTTKLPEPQRGGYVTVQAQARNGDGEIMEVETSLLVRLAGVSTPEPDSPAATPPIPDEPEQHFTGDPDPAFAPTLAYPNDGTLLPPNLGTLEVHFLPGATENSLFRVVIQGPAGDFVIYTRCADQTPAFVPGACSVAITGADFAAVSATNQGLGAVTLSVQGSDEAGHFGASAEFEIEFAAERVDGAVYYWSTNDNGTIVRFDFGSGLGTPETFLAPGDVPDNSRCVGCHALSRDGSRMLFGLSNSGDAELGYIADLTKDRAEPDYFTYNGSAAGSDAELTLLGAFAPDGESFVTVRRKGAADPDETLFFNDSATGLAASSLSLPFVPSHPDWSPKGDQIAVTNITGNNSSSIEFSGGGISLIEQVQGEWDGANPVHLVPGEDGKNRFAPSYLPDASLLLYTEVNDSGYSGTSAGACLSSASTTRFCNAYSDPGAEIWAVPPVANATPVFLARAAAPGVADELPGNGPPQADVGPTDFMDTFPKATPFVTEHRGKKLYWYTVSSQRRAGLREKFPNGSVVGDPASQALLWMFALDADQVKNGKDGSYPGFFLPFQDLSTSNHMAQWTERIADAPDPPAPPSPPPPPPPPPPITK